MPFLAPTRSSYLIFGAKHRTNATDSAISEHLRSQIRCLRPEKRLRQEAEVF